MNPFESSYKYLFRSACGELDLYKCKDDDVQKALRGGDDAQVTVRDWMRGYGLFQGINKKDRERIASKALAFARTKAPAKFPENELPGLFNSLHDDLQTTVHRSWMSATSKLLWCLYPHNIVIYDAFAHQAACVLQALDPGQLGARRIGNPPAISSDHGASRRRQHATTPGEWYAHYYALVHRIHDQSRDIRDAMKRESSVSYPYDIRITDKILWILGNPNYSAHP